MHLALPEEEVLLGSDMEARSALGFPMFQAGPETQEKAFGNYAIPKRLPLEGKLSPKATDEVESSEKEKLSLQATDEVENGERKLSQQAI